MKNGFFILTLIGSLLLGMEARADGIIVCDGNKCQKIEVSHFSSTFNPGVLKNSGVVWSSTGPSSEIVYYAENKNVWAQKPGRRIVLRVLGLRPVRRLVNFVLRR